MEKIRLLTLGGLDEDGRNMTVVEIDQDIFIVDCGLKYPEQSLLGVESIICDFSYLVARKDRLKAILITHGHDDVMGGLPYLIKETNVPIYASPFTAILIRNLLRKHQIKDFQLTEVKANSVFKIGSRKIKTFSLTHSICDTFGYAIDTQYGYIAFAVEFIIDFDISRDCFACDITQLTDLGREGVFLLATESRSSSREGFTSPKHRTKETLYPYIEGHRGRVIITLYEQNVFRLLEVLEIAKQIKRRVYFASENQREYLIAMQKLGYYTNSVSLEVPKGSFRNDDDDVLIIVSAQGPKVFRLMHKIALGEHEKIMLKKSDLVVVASPVVAGTEKDASKMENELFKEGVLVQTLHRHQVLTMHPSMEDLKMMLSLLKPQYYMPIKGEYRQLIDNAHLALQRNYFADHIIVLDNGQVAEFDQGKLSRMSEIIPLEDIFIDGNESLDASGLVLRDREILATDGTIIVGVVIDFQNKAILGGPDVQSRGVIYLKDADYIVKECANIIENVIIDMVSNHNYENSLARNEAKEQISKYIYKMTGKRPMILPVIIEINQ